MSSSHNQQEWCLAHQKSSINVRNDHCCCLYYHGSLQAAEWVIREKRPELEL